MSNQYPSCEVFEKQASILAAIRLPHRHQTLAEGCLDLLSDETFVYVREDNKTIEVSGEAIKLVDEPNPWREANKWVRETVEFFQSLEIDAQVEWYIQDYSQGPFVQCGTLLLLPRDNRLWVEFTHGGPESCWSYHPLSDYRLTK